MKRFITFILLISISVAIVGCAQSEFKTKLNDIVKLSTSALDKYSEAKNLLNEKKYVEASNKALEAKVEFLQVLDKLNDLKEFAKTDEEKKLVNDWITATQLSIESIDAFNNYITHKQLFDAMTPIPDPSYIEMQNKVNAAFMEWINKESKAMDLMGDVIETLKKL